MTNNPRYASLYQINTRVWLTELSHALGRAATLDDIPDAELDRIAALGFDWMWFLSVWQTGPAAQRTAADIQSLADLTNSFEVARTMQIAPITRDALHRRVAATLAPVVPLALTMMPRGNPEQPKCGS